MRITILTGGNSPERTISLSSAQAITTALTHLGHQVQTHDLTSVTEVLTMTTLQTADLIFPALHGGTGEDGHLQAILDLLDVPYALSTHLPSALAMNKAATKRIMTSTGIQTPDWLLVTWDRATGGPVSLNGSTKTTATTPTGSPLSLPHLRTRALAELDLPLVIKLNSAGSSVGVEIAETTEQFDPAFEAVAAAASGHRTEILLEKYIPGQELTAAILLGRRLPLLEIRPHKGHYDYANKYTPGATDYLCPAPIDSPHYENMCADALRLYDLLGCQGLARVDFRFDGTQHYCLEINTIPGMTETSLVPKAAAAVGITFEALVEDLCRDALLRRGLPIPD